MSSSFLDALVKLCEAYYEKVNQLEGEKYDMEKEVELKDYRVCNIVLQQPTKIPYIPVGNTFMEEYIFVWSIFNNNPPACIQEMITFESVYNSGYDW